MLAKQLISLRTLVLSNGGICFRSPNCKTVCRPFLGRRWHMLLSNCVNRVTSTHVLNRIWLTCQLLENRNRRNKWTSNAIATALVLWIGSFTRFASGNEVFVTDEAPFESQSEIFEVSTRHLCDQFRSINFDHPSVEVNKWAGNHWLRSDIETAWPADPRPR